VVRVVHATQQCGLITSLSHMAWPSGFRVHAPS